MNTTTPLLRLEGLAKSFGPVAAVQPLDLTVLAGDFCAILGPSGCGKSTLLRMIAGFTEVSSGRIVIDGQDVAQVGPEKRPTNMVFQGYGLFPHLNVAQNVAFGLELRKHPREEIEERVREALKLVRLEGFAARSPDKLSGGQQQRVALARALIMRPKILLLDEPLAALDLKLRHQMQDELSRIHASIGGTFIFVTHDQSEAFALANRIVVMNEGRVEQIGSPQEVYRQPASMFVANFVGETSVLKGSRRDGIVTLSAGFSFASEGPDGAVNIIVRPEQIRIVERGLRGTVINTQYLGDSVKIQASLASNETITARVPDDGQSEQVKLGDVVAFNWLPEMARVIGAPRP